MPSHTLPSSRARRSTATRIRSRVIVVGLTACALVATGSGWAPGPATTATPVVDLTGSQPAAVKKSIAPSGKAAPKKLSGWRQVFRDEFTGSKLKRTWTRYSGQPGGNPAGYWKPSHVDVEKGMLRLKTYQENGRWVSGGVGAWNGFSMKYGRVDVRFRAKKATGVGYVFLLWPRNGGWPPEIDFAEDGGHTRRSTAATLHYGASNQQIQRHKSANFTKWKTIGVRWSPGKLTYTLNGKPWATVKHRGVPNVDMVLALQSATACNPWHKCPDRSTPKRSSIDIDWVAAYKKS